MSKMDGLRAMREARYEQAAARAKQPGPTPRPARQAAPPVKPTKPTKSATTDAVPADEARLCGHRAISGRTCTREHGHAAKSHRYS